MAMNYVQLWQAIQDYSENTESLFVNNIPRFVIEAEDRIYNSVQIPVLRKNVTGTLTAGNQYLSLPSDWLSNYSVAIYTSDYTTVPFTYLLNKDVNFIREAYPSPSSQGTPKYYALFGPQYTDHNSLSLIMGPTPDQAYQAELHYFYYPVSIVQGVAANSVVTNTGFGYTNGFYTNVPLNGGSGSGFTADITVAGQIVTNVVITDGGNFYIAEDVLTVTNSYLGGSGSGFQLTVNTVNNTAGTSWLGNNYDPVLFYGAMREAMLFMKGEADLVKYYEDKYQEALAQLKRLGDGLERGDAYRDGQTKLMVKT